MLTNKSFGNKTYDALKYIALVVLPALGALYFGLAGIWDLPKVNEVLGTIAVLDTVLGIVLNRSNQNYMNSDERFSGNLVVTNSDVAVEVEDPIQEIAEQEEVVLKVDDHTVAPVVSAPVKKRAPRKVPPK